ncbi:hypothetical protein OGAPHI_003817 [Ogataea philodendri]|uniref:FAD dependent oxidoreductase domain-containing protein n=1 Tax=Ogataea philodendri TaxID=1378263 RepID=A0A9P8T4V0_9ASCO|nr:uncharacterized protein OGAPHI_003817 [Ogataea philodendri]KAH3665629.1 hypothetical protein OGAPHI_003817 [Ogataea philodendri]
MEHTVVVIGLSFVSVCIAKHLAETCGRYVVLVSTETLQDVVSNENIAHIVQHPAHKTQQQNTLHTFQRLAPNPGTLAVVDRLQQSEIGTASSSQSILINPRQMLVDMYQFLTSLGPQFKHFVLPSQVSSLEHYCSMFPTATSFVNCSVGESMGCVRVQSVLLHLNSALDYAVTHKTALNQHTKLTPVVGNPQLAVLSGPHQYNDFYIHPRDSDTLTLLYRASTYYPHIVAACKVLSSEVIFKQCMENQCGKIFLTIGPRGQKIVNVLGFGLTEADVIDEAIEYVPLLVKSELKAHF